ncbi:hypothetical protein BJS_08976 [Bradyrhizobium japonicum SEMIA 5079]|nr:hypothetical protein BJS_08976 [Bradyrhizobium japonicum SEMIA 5079]
MGLCHLRHRHAAGRPWVDFIAPSVDVLKPILANGTLKALLVTHAHEDHIDATSRSGSRSVAASRPTRPCSPPRSSSAACPKPVFAAR